MERDDEEGLRRRQYYPSYYIELYSIIVILLTQAIPRNFDMYTERVRRDRGAICNLVRPTPQDTPQTALCFNPHNITTYCCSILHRTGFQDPSHCYSTHGGGVAVRVK